MYPTPPSIPSQPRSWRWLRRGCLALGSIPLLACTGMQAVITSLVLVFRWATGQPGATPPQPTSSSIMGLCAAWISFGTMIWLLWATFAFYPLGTRPTEQTRGMVLVISVVAFVSALMAA